MCVFCGANSARPTPTTEAGKALRALYDRYGRDAVLANSAILTNGLGDLMDDTTKLRGQLRIAMDAGAGRMLKAQLEDSGTPDASFDARFRALLTDEAGLSDKVAGEIAAYFDEMIGWRSITSAPTPQPKPVRQPIVEQPRYEEEQHPVNSTVANTQQTVDGRNPDVSVKVALPDKPVPTLESVRKGGGKTIGGAVIMLIIGVLNYILGKTSGSKVAFWGVIDLEWVLIPCAGLIFIIGISDRFKKRKKQLYLRRSGSTVTCTWEVKGGPNSIQCLALNGKWVDTGVTSPYTLKSVPEGSTVTLAWYQSNGNVDFIDDAKV